MCEFDVTSKVQRFPGDYGWYYIELDDGMSKELRAVVREKWPSLLRSTFTLNDTSWESSIMPIKDGPLFIALPAKVRKAENIRIDQEATVHVVARI